MEPLPEMEPLMTTGDLQVGSIVGQRYRIERCIGPGWLGKAFVAEDLLNGNPVALKTIRRSAGLNGKGLETLREELSEICLFRHPNLVRVLDYGVTAEGRTPFLVQEHFDGRDLWPALQSAGIESKMAALARLCRVLQFLHSRGILHRNISRSSILVPGDPAEVDKLKATDYGLSRWIAAFGPPDFRPFLPWTAPEVLMGHPASRRSDFYSIGVLAYLLLGERLPFEDEDTGYLLQKMLQGSPDLRPIERLPGGPGLAQVLRTLLEKDPERRPSSAEEVVRLFNVAAAGLQPAVSPEEPDGFMARPKFVGRQQEMGLLKDRAAEVRDTGRGWTVFISGEPGSGKTRCMEELRGWALLAGWRVFETACYPQEDKAYGSFRRFLELTDSLYQVGAEVDKAGDAEFRLEKYSRTDEAGFMDMAAESAIGRFRDLIAREVVRRAAGRPTILLLHDFHWADEAVSSVLGYIISDIPAHPVLLCVSCRVEETSRSWMGRVIEQARRQEHAEMLVLGALPLESVGQLVSGMMVETEGAPHFLPWLYRVSGGNPFFVDEILKQLVDRGRLRKRSGRWQLAGEQLEGVETPENLNMILRQRLKQLPSRARAIAQWMALIGRPLDPGLLARLTGLSTEELAAGIGELIGRQVICRAGGLSDTQFEFRHPLVAEVMLKGIKAARRRRMHGEVGAVVEKLVDPDAHLIELATHFTEGQCGDKAVDYALRAAKACKAEFSSDGALRFYEYVLAHPGDLPADKICEVTLEAADALCILGHPNRALRLLEGKAKSLRTVDRIRRAQLVAQMAWAHQHLGNIGKAQMLC
ncbi:MAG: hypothetical protein FJW35_08720, partial [Acidobacteria bacterium]|nr:hypothetical protein [Acidobacteriota bacterium]